jgi:hypothetical protein
MGVIQWSFNGHSVVILWSFGGHSVVIGCHSVVIGCHWLSFDGHSVLRQGKQQWLVVVDADEDWD